MCVRTFASLVECRISNNILCAVTVRPFVSVWFCRTMATIVLFIYNSSLCWTLSFFFVSSGHVWCLMLKLIPDIVRSLTPFSAVVEKSKKPINIRALKQTAIEFYLFSENRTAAVPRSNVPCQCHRHYYMYGRRPRARVFTMIWHGLNGHSHNSNCFKIDNRFYNRK